MGERVYIMVVFDYVPRKDGVTILLFAEEGQVGQVTLNWPTGEYWIQGLQVTQSVQRKGYGSVLLNEAVTVADKAHAKYIMLKAIHGLQEGRSSPGLGQQKLIAFYERHGFNKTTNEEFPLMRKELR
jgi:GNAT superfamily N-acetyltransferase